MQLPNRDGATVDSVPFLVTSVMAFLVAFSFGPLYGSALGFSIPVAVAGSAVGFLLATAAAYYRLVWEARPDLEEEIPAAQRLTRLFYVAIALALFLVLLALPLVYRSMS